jgi:hypothetical protein
MMISHTFIAQSSCNISLKQVLAEHLGASVIPNQCSLHVIIPAGQTVTICDDLINFDDQTNSKHVLTFSVEESANLFYSVRLTPETLDHLTTKELLPVDPALSSVLEKELIIQLAGKNAQATVSCATLAQGNRIIKFKTLQHHQAPQTTSSLVIKAVLDQQSKVFCNSMIKVEKAAQQTNAQLENKNILLSKQARAVSIPQLEIEANDVKCQHGATMSKLNDEEMFYLQSRGVNMALTKKLLIEGFLQ